MTRWYECTMRQTIYRIPCDSLDASAVNRADPNYLVSAAVAIKVRLEQRTDQILLVDGKECRSSAVFSTYDEVQWGDRFFLSEADLNEGNLNRSKRLLALKSSPELLSDTVLREATL